MGGGDGHAIPNLTARVAGFVRHLRLNGFPLGPAEAADALHCLDRFGATSPDDVRLSLRALLAGRLEEWERFDDLFEAYWLARGRVRQRPAAAADRPGSDRTPAIWRRQDGTSPSERRGPTVSGEEADGGQEAAARPGERYASTRASLARTDLRHVVDPEELAEAERLAYRLARAIRYRLSRRRRAAARGPTLDLRRTIRRNLGHGGEPLELRYRRRPDRPVRLVVLLDVSGSMKQYSRFYLQFLKGLLASWLQSDAYLFHTRLVRVTDALREQEPLRAMTRTALLAEGFGGGTRIGEALRRFNNGHAKRALNSRSVVVVISDGFDAGEPGLVGIELARLKRRARRLVWLNPLLGWAGYEPSARAMAEALPHVDLFRTAHTLASLASIEGELARL